MNNAAPATAPAAASGRRNDRAQNCAVCGEMVEARKGYLFRGKRWEVKCEPCSGIVAEPMGVTIALSGKQITIKTTGPRMEPDLFGTYRRAIEGARWSGDEGLNRADMDKAAGIIKRLSEAGFTLNIDPAVSEAVLAVVDANRSAVASATANADAVDAMLRERGMGLYPFQRQGTAWLASRVGALLSDEMGLGKTIQTLAALPRGCRALVVAPAVAKGVWARECRKWRPDLTPNVLSGIGTFRWPEPGEVLITNYDILRSEPTPIVAEMPRSATQETTGATAPMPVAMGDIVTLMMEVPAGTYVVQRQQKDGAWKPITMTGNFQEALATYRQELLNATPKNAGKPLSIRVAGIEGPVVHSVVGTAATTADEAAAVHRGIMAMSDWAHRAGGLGRRAPFRYDFSVQVLSCKDDGTTTGTLASWNDSSRMSLDSADRRVAVPRNVSHVRVSWEVYSKNTTVTFGVGFKPRRTWSDPPEGVILVGDEAHLVKSPKAERTSLFRAISEDVRANKGRSWLLTATPLLNSAPELWSILQAGGIAQEAFGSWPNFMRLFGGHEGSFGIEWGGEISEEVPGRLQRVCLRRLRKDVLPELPTKRYQTIPVEIGAAARKLCDEAEEFLRQQGVDLSGEVTEAALARLTLPGFEKIAAARAALASAKIGPMLEVVDSFEQQAEPLVVFSAHRAPIDLLAKRPGWKVITGDTPNDQRTAIEEAFQRGELKGVGATIKAGGVAITLTKSAFALFVDREWNPALNDQAADRICRIGQNRGCLITTLEAEHALDARVNELLAAKTDIIEASVQAASRIDAPLPETTLDVDFDKLAAEANARREEADKARAEAERVAAERAEAAVARKEEEEKTENERKERKEKAKRYEAAKIRARARGWLQPAEEPSRHAPRTAREQWAAQALVTLAADDPDFAQEDNGIGFSKSDVGQGHFLSIDMQYGLTDSQWAMAIRLCRKYHRQIGRCPAAEPADVPEKAAPAVEAVTPETSESDEESAS